MIGYTTGTFDFVHEGHFQLLRNMKQRCTTLIVGLASNALASRQKRPPVMDYWQRKAILDHCKYVDQVVAHNGETKEQAHAKLRFGLLLIGDDYVTAPEYTQFTLTPVLYIPRTHGISTSCAWSQLLKRVISQDLHLLGHGLDGPLWQCGHTVFKPVHVGHREYVHAPTLHATKDAYCLGLPEPRNWKGSGMPDAFPPITGTNPYRQLLISMCLQEFAWYPVRTFTQKYINVHSAQAPGGGVQALVAERRQPRVVYWLEQEYAGRPLSQYDGEQWDDLMTQLRTILHDLAQQGVVHGDIHLDNLCVNDAGQLALLDFGWCLWRGFALCPDEVELLEERLRTDFDAEHFRASLTGTQFAGRF
jgi:glycerol-3-phosphate cytidylyltransferase